MDTASPYLRIDINESDLDQQVSKVHIVVHTEGRWENSSLSNNHVTQYLSIPNGRSVQINERHVGDDDINGRFEMVSRSYRYNDSRSLITSFEVALREGVTVRAICTLVSRQRLNDFCFAAGGMGCRHWHITLIACFEMKGWVAPTSGIRVLESLSFQYSRAAPPAPITVRPGSFDERETHELAIRVWNHMHHQLQASVQAVSTQRQFVSSILSNLTDKPGLAAQQLQQLSARGIVLRNPGAVRSHLSAIQVQYTAAEGRLSRIERVLEDFESLARERAEEAD